MIRVFIEQDEYVEFLTGLPLVQGDLFCTTFIPSALFQKDAIEMFFSRIERPGKPDVVAKRLWAYSRKIRRAVFERRATLCIEASCLRQLCKSGVIHEASPQFTVTYPTRVAVFNELQEMNRRGHIFITPSTIPFVFRLHPPSGILIDVQRNVAAQRIHGMWLEDADAYAGFAGEAKRLIKSAGQRGTGNALDRDIKMAVGRLRSGDHYEWPW